MTDANSSLRGKFHVAQTYDFTGAFAISFMWYGADGGPVRFTITTPTGNLITDFDDGSASWRRVYLPMNQFNKTGTGGGIANMSSVTGIFWALTSPGLRRVDLLMLHEEPTIKCLFAVRRSIDLEMKGKFFVYRPGSVDVKGKFTI